MNIAKRILDRADGRKLARELLETFVEEIGTIDTEAFVDEFKKQLLPKPKVKLSMSFSYLKVVHLPFGKHINKTFDETPLSYLEWLCGESEKFLKELQAYLKHPENNRFE